MEKQQVQSFDFYTKWVENIYYQYLENDIEGILIHNNDLLHSQNKYNYMMESIFNYLKNTNRHLLNSGIYLESWKDYNYSLEFVKSPEDLTFIKNEKLISHQDGHIIIDESFSVTNNEENKLVLLQFTKQDNQYVYKYIDIPIDITKVYPETNVSFTDVLFDTQKFLNTFGDEQGVLPTDKYEEQIYKLFQWLYKNIDSFVDYINNLLENFQFPILEYFTHQYIQDNQSYILKQIEFLFKTDYLNNIYNIEWQKDYENDNLLFNHTDKHFFFIGYKTNFDQMVLNSDIGIIYIVPLFITIFNSLQLMYKQVIINIDESIIENYIPTEVKYIINLKLFKNLKYKY